MNFVKNVLNYYFKNFIYIILFTIVPAIYFGALLHPFALFEFLPKYTYTDINTFGNLFNVVYGMNWWSVLLILIGLVMIVVFLCVMLGFIENHFRTGNPNIENSFKLNSNVISVSITVVLLAICTFIINILAMLLIYLIHFIAGTSTAGLIVGQILSIIIAVLILYPTARIFSVMAFATIEMIINGSSLRVGISNALTALGKDIWRVFLMEVTIFLSCAVVVALFSLIGVAWLGNIMVLMAFLPLLCIYAMEIFFDYYGIKKYNNRKYYNLR